MPSELHHTRTTSGLITSDPLRSLPIGSELQVTSNLFAAQSKVGLNSVSNWDFFNGAVVALHFGNTKGQRILGSGVLVAPGVAITARHVIEPEKTRLISGEQELICTGISQQGLVIWKCHQATLVEHADIALLMIRCASALPSPLQQATLTTRMPRVGEQIVIAGIRDHADSSIEIGTPSKISMMVGCGSVTARYERARDRVLLPSPCFEVDCPAMGGMSGGPAFDEAGFLVGLVASSFEGESPGPTFLSLLWPAFVEQINPSWPDGLSKSPTTLLGMDRRICAIHRPEAIQVSRDELGRTTATYHFWD